MGTTVFSTDATAEKIIADELRPYEVAMFTSNAEGACVATNIPVTDDNRERLAETYALKDGQEVVTIAFVIKAEGLNKRGMRSVSIKTMDETMGPFVTGGATTQILNALTPLNADNPAAKYAIEWRARAAQVAA